MSEVIERQRSEVESCHKARQLRCQADVLAHTRRSFGLSKRNLPGHVHSSKFKGLDFLSISSVSFQEAAGEAIIEPSDLRLDMVSLPV